MTYGLDLKETFQAMGMVDAFTPEKADFSGMSDRALFVDWVIHQAFVEVNEEGTEAAGVTAMVSTAARDRPSPPPPPEFCADHPFLFLIQSTGDGSVLFLGRITDPPTSGTASGFQGGGR